VPRWGGSVRESNRGGDEKTPPTKVRTDSEKTHNRRTRRKKKKRETKKRPRQSCVEQVKPRTGQQVVSEKWQATTETYKTPAMVPSDNKQGQTSGTVTENIGAISARQGGKLEENGPRWT